MSASNFPARHIGPDSGDLDQILRVIGVDSLDDLARAAVPSAILDPADDNGLGALPAAIDEHEALAELRALADRNTVDRTMIGLGYYDTLTPPVLLRNIIENPAWYTAYTPYQPEISQGRLEALLNFQTMVSDLTGMEIANSSMLDEATAAAEAMTLLRRAGKSTSPRLIVDRDVFPQTLAVIETRAEPLGIEVLVHDVTTGLPEGEFFGVILQTPGASGRIADVQSVIDGAHERGALVAVGADLLAMTLLTPPGEQGADACFGTTQRFGVPLGFGGPHAGYLAVHSKHARQIPGRLVGVSVDADGNLAYRLALQTREQHIRREKATSNICTAQVLLAVLAAMYASYHGPEGLKAIALRVHARASEFAAALGDAVVHADFFDTVLVQVPGRADDVLAAAKAAGYNLWRVDDDHISVAFDETSTPADVAAVLAAFDAKPVNAAPSDIENRTSEFLTHPAFHAYRTETAMLRYLRKLADKDIALDRSMIPLGSCTMKLNATAEMESITWPEFSRLHPFAPAADTEGIRALIAQLEEWLVAITGYDNVSLQPNAGSQGEYAGLLAIRNYHLSRGDAHRTVCLIPSSAHGTNAASAVMAGLKVVVVASRESGDVDTADLKEKIAKHADELAAIMITYPSTHGVYEHEVREICGAVHEAGGQVYVDGANMNALVGLARPGKFGGDVSHLNLHKTFCIPHGGGGPGVGPIGVRSHLAPFLPGHPLEPSLGNGPTISAAPFGSASILPITWAYIRMMGADGLRRATLTAIASANYIAARLGESFPVLYTGENGRVAHECILDVRGISKETGVSIDDVAKRLADYGFHAPTMSFPVAGTLMVEPTESESLGEIDEFCEAMIAIRAEIDRVASGEWPVDDNPLRGAPHTAECLVAEWDHPYSREVAVYPQGLPSGGARAKVWPSVRRIDGVYGDRNLVCSCPPIEAFAE
ncbi:Glycine dehydrogenase (decarboxylating) OS=Tsukamurella paurometabola (strain ATCC 8368 / DSM/ CCUG 35730 / CIP 100753 / JCM 10117 / KCTC 9821 / NBRC 16120/ NCIMB 702349 / NCTC 13040) OX=521096 GN=gcvP PE=3 SV=1 [Tsukamurella paurometabola]|uniref:Glycine dehydrogenase (decarboxylating) n=1 Tax=Tsukamurella paurometabola (strain ATCC 8368 / DSM 20162 / CCUG 35730 / CIP 100753 / JCM 10117 / KCTC 9821 / NBRC 16120 / NCIMB 702349 / NCTC 13040) TaxID=521096 RepID=D5UQH1_TSUPD|nr:aminomethyl-transferring glycine dehydrogenase [Tsukamurella paurometabola]ADG78941.1 glycine dehydrogenase [Tsukamurella paurometabola DSM 20162]SUP33571.1 Glycine dehydrogenase [decarboxylating] [Tsukamurella paurometabola]